MENADSVVQRTMNNTLAEIGIHVPTLRKRAIAIGEKLGIYRDYPVSKGWTSPLPDPDLTQWRAGRAESSCVVPLAQH